MRQVLLASTFLALVLAGGPAAFAQDQPVVPKAPAVAALNLNTATATQLENLPGVGPKMALLIIDYRQKNGGFKKVEELMNIRGIGEKSFLKLKSLIVVTPPKPERATTGQ